MMGGRVLVAVVLVACILPGCSGGRGRSAHLTPDDFAGVPGDTALVAAMEAQEGSDAEDPAGRGETGLSPSPPTMAKGDPSAGVSAGGLSTKFDVDAMIGQVNGQPIYARDVLEPLNAELEVMGRELSADVFRMRLIRRGKDGSRLIPDRLTGIVIEALILGEAERDLSDREQFVVKNHLKKIREELLTRFYNSITLAEVSLRETTGLGLEATIEGRRKAMIVERYVRQKLLPKINVTRYDIENYYHMHEDEFNEPTGRKVRMIRTDSSTAADQIEAALADGTPFIEVASGRLNHYKPDEGGLYSARAAGDEIFGPKVLNEAVLALVEDEHSARIKLRGFFVWLFVEAIYSGQAQSLAEAQDAIRRKLQQLQYTHLFDEYRGRLFSSYLDSLRRLQKSGGPGTSLQQMTDMLVDIAVSRYAVMQ